MRLIAILTFVLCLSAKAEPVTNRDSILGIWLVQVENEFDRNQEQIYMRFSNDSMYQVLLDMGDGMEKAQLTKGKFWVKDNIIYIEDMAETLQFELEVKNADHWVLTNPRTGEDFAILRLKS